MPRWLGRKTERTAPTQPAEVTGLYGTTCVRHSRTNTEATGRGRSSSGAIKELRKLCRAVTGPSLALSLATSSPTVHGLRRRSKAHLERSELRRPARARRAPRKSWAADGPREAEKRLQPTANIERRNRRSTAKSFIDPAPVQGVQLSPANSTHTTSPVRPDRASLPNEQLRPVASGVLPVSAITGAVAETRG